VNKAFTRPLTFLFLIFFSGISPLIAQTSQPSRPNILLIVADDLGYADLGCYGGEIKTPNIDLLARNGVRFTHFYTAPLCAPTRSMLMSGNDNHVAGMGSMFPVKGTSREGKTGYEQHLTDRIVTIAQILKEGGYQTFMAGKWHLGSRENEIPYAKGFEKSFALMNGAANHFNNKPIQPNQPTQFRQDSQVVLFPEGNFSTDVYSEKMIGFIKDAKKDKPFFAYLAYTAPHWPLQVPADYIDRYKGRYDMGYDSLRAIRFERQKRMGIVPDSMNLRPANPEIKPWINLSAEEKKLESRKMEIYAAMVENLDDHIGLLIKVLRDSNLLDNTIIVFMSDNGAAGEDFYKLPKGNGPYLRENYDNHYENMGSAGSFVSYGPQWAQAGAAPFKLFKGYATEGGVAAPLIISGKMVVVKPGIQNSLMSVMDLAPGFLELAHLNYPVYYYEHKVMPMMGESFVPCLQGRTKSIHSDKYVLGMEHDGECFIIKDHWKITNISEPYDEQSFELYDLASDRGETRDLSKVFPKKFEEMMNEWIVFKNKVGVVPMPKEE
jgi:arylsulfatase A-like enzyme